MRTKGGLGMWALNELVAIAPTSDDQHEADIAHGSQALYSDIPSLLWSSIRQQAAEEGVKAAPWLRRAVCIAVQTTEHWRPQTPAQQFKLAYVAFCVAGRTDEFFLQVANALMKPQYTGNPDRDIRPRSSRWGVSPDDLRGHPLLQDDRCSVPTHALFDNLSDFDFLLSFYHRGNRSEACAGGFVEAILDKCDP